MLKIGDIELALPEDQKLKHILSRHPTYDYVHWNIIRALFSENGIRNPQLIDVGANIGDTIAHFRRFSAGRAVGVEAHPPYFQLLTQNLKDQSDVVALNALVCPRDAARHVTLVAGESTGMTTLSSDGGTYGGKTVDCAELLRRMTGPYIFKTDTDGFDAMIMGDLMSALAAGLRGPSVVSCEGPNESQMRAGDYARFRAAMRQMCHAGYHVLILTNVGSVIGYVGTDADKLDWHLRALTRALNAGIGYCPYFDFIAAGPDLTCDTFAFRHADSTIFTDVHKPS